ncbi:MAG: 3-deoxy-7-phosphoheptulonate synthase [Candidatus Woesearchaeota archaeon]
MKKEILNSLRDLNIVRDKVTPILSPDEIRSEIPGTDIAGNTILQARKNISDIINGNDSRFLLFIGPCSVHHYGAGIEYAQWLADTIVPEVKDNMVVIMRTYFEKPRTTIGWKGMIRDPHINATDDTNEGLRLSRNFLVDVTNLGLATSMEVLGSISVTYLDELLSHGSIGARTIESQPQREVASGLSFPIGYKNSMTSDVIVALDAIKAAYHKHTFVGMEDNGDIAFIPTKGNPNGHLILRGGYNGTHHPNYDAKNVNNAITLAKNRQLNPYLVIDASHGNSGKDYTKQPEIGIDVATQRAQGNKYIVGLMFESYHEDGNQDINFDKGLEGHDPYVSITDACMGKKMTYELVMRINDILSK